MNSSQQRGAALGGPGGGAGDDTHWGRPDAAVGRW